MGLSNEQLSHRYICNFVCNVLMQKKKIPKQSNEAKTKQKNNPQCVFKLSLRSLPLQVSNFLALADANQH